MSAIAFCSMYSGTAAATGNWLVSQPMVHARAATVSRILPTSVQEPYDTIGGTSYFSQTDLSFLPAFFAIPFVDMQRFWCVEEQHPAPMTMMSRLISSSVSVSIDRPPCSCRALVHPATATAPLMLPFLSSSMYVLILFPNMVSTVSVV